MPVDAQQQSMSNSRAFTQNGNIPAHAELMELWTHLCSLRRQVWGQT